MVSKNSGVTVLWCFDLLPIDNDLRLVRQHILDWCQHLVRHNSQASRQHNLREIAVPIQISTLDSALNRFTLAVAVGSFFEEGHLKLVLSDTRLKQGFLSDPLFLSCAPDLKSCLSETTALIVGQGPHYFKVARLLINLTRHRCDG